LNRGETLLTPLFYSALEYVIMKAQEGHEGLQRSEARQLLVYANDNNVLGDNSVALSPRANYTD
jgi:hypothetical protein